MARYRWISGYKEIQAIEAGYREIQAEYPKNTLQGKAQAIHPHATTMLLSTSQSEIIFVSNTHHSSPPPPSQTVNIQRAHENTRTGNCPESGFWSLREAPLDRSQKQRNTALTLAHARTILY